MKALLGEIDALVQRFLPQNKSAEGGPGSGRHATSGTARYSSKSEAEREFGNAIASYTGIGYVGINSSLRRGGSVGETAKDIDEHMSSMPKDVTYLYRGVPKLPVELKEGATFRDKAFVSTSTDENVAKGFLPFGNRVAVVMKVINPSASKAIDLRRRGVSKGEKEILLARNTKFKVVGVYKNAGTDRYGNKYHEVAVKIIK